MVIVIMHFYQSNISQTSWLRVKTIILLTRRSNNKNHHLYLIYDQLEEVD